MLRRQLNKLSMLMALNEYFVQNRALVQVVPDFESTVAALQSVVDRIQTASLQQSMKRNGVGSTKKLLKADLIAVCADIARKLTAYAALHNDYVLLNEVRTTDYKLSRLPDEELAGFCRIILDLGKQDLATVSPYGLDQTNLDRLAAGIASFVEILPTLRLAVIEKKQATEQLGSLFRQADEWLVKADLLVGIVKLSQPDFYAGYKACRMIVDHVGRGLRLKISVVGKSDGKPVKGALCQLIREGAAGNAVELSKKTAIKGSIHVKSLEEGKYRLRVRKTGYKTSDQEVYITGKEFETVVVELEEV
jgi:hypothetical protein